jgi:hypothetical protein
MTDGKRVMMLATRMAGMITNRTKKACYCKLCMGGAGFFDDCRPVLVEDL